MDILDRHRPAGLRVRIAIVTAIVALTAFWVVPMARADGDPASDVLVTYPYYLNWDAGVSPHLQAQLGAVLSAAARGGFPIRVAVIATRNDLGTVTPLWDQPRSYASYLGYELSYVYTGQVLVVMPNGYGLYSSKALPQAEWQPEVRAIDAMNPPGGGERLASGALAAVRTLAAAAGHPLPGEIVVRNVPSGASGSASVLPWIVFVLGLVMIAIAWTLSLRARPLGSRRGRVSAT